MILSGGARSQEQAKEMVNDELNINKNQVIDFTSNRGLHMEGSGHRSNRSNTGKCKNDDHLVNTID